MYIEEKARNRNVSRKNQRFYTSLDMAIIKKDVANQNGRIKRGEFPKFGNAYIIECGCGHEGCFLHSGNDSPKEENVFSIKEKPKTKKNDYKVDWKSVEFLDNYLKEMNEKNK